MANERASTRRKPGGERAVEMTGLWKAWKAKSRLSTSSHEPLGNLAKSRRDSHIPTAPAARRMEKVENRKAGFPLSHRTASFSLLRKRTRRKAGATLRLKELKSNC